MPEPKILDSDGAQLAKGVRVVTAGSGHMPAGALADAGRVHFLDLSRCVGKSHEPLVWVRWPDEDTTCDDCYRVFGDPATNTFTCPDLKAVLTPDLEEKP
jgi:hypothetical protein